MKVLHIITGLDRGGAETMLTRLVTHHGAQSIVVSLTGEGPLGPILRDAGVTVFSLGITRGRASIRGFLRLVALIRREQPDIVQTWLYHADFAGMLAALFVRRPRLVWNLRCSDMDLARYPWTTSWIRFLLARLACFPTTIVVNSEAGKRYHAMLGYRPKSWTLIPNGFDPEQFRPDEAAREALRRALVIGENDPLIGMVARVDPMKDYATFLAAAELIVEKCPEARFLLVGRDTERLPISAKLVGRLHALGERGDVAALLPALDVFVLSSAFGEGFPNAVGEAMACGVPCAATNVGDAAAIIGDTGAIVPVRDPGALCDAVLDVLSRGKNARIGARQRILDHYTISAVTRYYDRLYHAVLAADWSPTSRANYGWWR
jgi:glycosyltransferase involved in cell wall biosynthesis